MTYSSLRVEKENMDAFHFFFMEKKISKLTAVVIVGGLVKFRKIIGLVPDSYLVKIYSFQNTSSSFTPTLTSSLVTLPFFLTHHLLL